MKLKRAKTGVALSLAAALAAGSATAQEMTLKLSQPFPTTVGLHTDFLEPWTHDLAACTDGKVAVEIHPAGSALGDITRQFDQAAAGVVDIAFGHTGIPRGRFPRTSLIELPFMAKSANSNSFALWNNAETLLKPEYPGVKILALMAHNPGVLHTNTPVHTMSDIKGLRIRTPNPSISLVLEHYGAEAVGLPPGDMYENLQKGTVDGVAIDWTGINAFKLDEVVEYHYDIPLYTVGFYFVMNQGRYDGLPDDVRACVDKLTGDDLVAKFGPWWDKWGKAGYDIEVETGDEITVATPEQIEQAKAELAPVTEQLLQAARDAGVENVDEIRDAFEAETAKYD